MKNVKNFNSSKKTKQSNDAFSKKSENKKASHNNTSKSEQKHFSKPSNKYATTFSSKKESFGKSDKTENKVQQPVFKSIPISPTPINILKEMRQGLVVSQLSVEWVEKGHPWITRDRDTGPTTNIKQGDILPVYNKSGEPIATALMDPEEDVIARILSLEILSRQETFELIKNRAISAFNYRKSLKINSNMYRIINAESDGIPGITIDRYGKCLIVHIYTPSSRAFLQIVLDAISSIEAFDSIYLKNFPKDRRQTDFSSQCILIGGKEESEEIICEENNIKYLIRPLSGFSTGIFFDQRENRDFLRQISYGRNVLNVFAYTGGFSLACILGSAKRVETIDSSQQSIDWAKRNFELNSFSTQDHPLLVADAFDFLHHRSKNDNAKNDLIILDPPTFSTTKENTWSPKKIETLNTLAIKSLAKNGWLVSISNYAGISEANFIETLRSAAFKMKKSLQYVHKLSSSSDFPAIAGFKESSYLKGIICRLV